MIAALVGAGPGDPGLLTLRGRELLEKAEVVIYDALVNPEILDYISENAEKIYVGKVASQHALPQPDINRLIADKASQGKRVVRLKGGDPYIFGRGGEEAEYLAERNIAFEVVPGISSAVAAPAYAGIPLTHRDLVSSVSIVTGHENPEKDSSAINWEALAASGSTLVFVMGVKNLPNISARLIRAGLPPKMPAAIIYRGTTPMQRSLFATLETLPQKAREACFANPSIIVVGKVAALCDKLDWFSRKPLLGRTIVVTRAREQASEMVQSLRQAGAEVIEAPSIAIQPLADYAEADAAIDSLSRYGWIIFTSVNGVKYFWQRLKAAGKDSRSLCGARVAAIGPATAAALLAKGIEADLTPPSYIAESVVKALVEREGHSLEGMKILLPRAAFARMIIPEELARHGATVDVVSLYNAEPAMASAENLRALLREKKIDCVCFGSSSTVRNFLNNVPAELLRENPRLALAAIGPVTASALADFDLRISIMPENYTIPALVAAVVEFFSKEEKVSSCR